MIDNMVSIEANFYDNQYTYTLRVTLPKSNLL